MFGLKQPHTQQIGPPLFSSSPQCPSFHCPWPCGGMDLKVGWSNLTVWAKRIMDGAEDALPEDATDFDIRTHALTRPTYTDTMRPTGSTLSARVDPDEDLLSETRGSTVMAGVYVRYEKSLENQAKAMKAREERQERDQVRQEMEQQQYDETQERRNRVRGRNQEAKTNLVTRNLERGQTVRDERVEIEGILDARREEIRQEHLRKYESLVGRDGRLDAQEEATDEAERQEATAARKARHAAVVEARKQRAETNHARAESLRMENAARLAQAALERDRKKAEAARQKREDSARALAQGAEREEEQRARALEIRERLNAQRAKAELGKEARRKLIERSGKQELETNRAFEAEFVETKERTFREKQDVRNKVFGSRYVDRASADQFSGSAFRKLHTMDDKADAEIAAQNLEILERIETVEPRTDDWMLDEAAGEARATFAAASAERKAREAAEIEQANAEMRERIFNQEALVDDLLDNEAAATRRGELKEASEARRQADAELARERNREMRDRIESVKAKTDDDVADDEAGAERIRAAEESRARKKAEAERIASENAAMRQRISSTAAVTDDDVMDEEEGMARAKLAAQSKKERKQEAAMLAKSNKEKRERLKNVKAIVDDDIDADPAGVARGR